MSILDLFQGIGTMFAQSPQIAIARVVLIFLGFLLVYLGVKGTLEPLIMVPMGLGMSAVNAGVLFLGENQIGNLIIDPLLSTTDELMTYMQINFLQPIYKLAPELFVPISIVAYLYLSLTYGGYPYLIKLLIPKEMRGKQIPKEKKVSKIRPKEKIVFAVITNALLCLLFPVAAPLFLSFFVGIVIRETGISAYIKMIGENFLYFATFFLGLMLGVLCDASTLLDATVVKLLILGMLSLLLSGISGYVVYFFKKGKFNPTVGIAGVSCVPSTAKVAQKAAAKANPAAFILDYALGANICGVITTAILTGIYITLLS